MQELQVRAGRPGRRQRGGGTAASESAPLAGTRICLNMMRLLRRASYAISGAFRLTCVKRGRAAPAGPFATRSADGPCSHRVEQGRPA
jgi:hypothetical protein